MAELTLEERWRRDIARDWRGFCNKLIRLATTCREFGPDIVAAAALAQRTADGYPGSAAGVGERRGTAADELPYADPTGNVIAHEPQIVTTERLLRENLAAALKALEAADRNATYGQRVLKQQEHDAPGRARAPGCVNCDRFEIYVAASAGKAGRCDDCFAYRETHNRDATEKIVRARAVNATPRQLARGAAIPPESAAWIAAAVDASRNSP